MVGAELPDNGPAGWTEETWGAADNGLLAVADKDGVGLWDVRNVRRPVLDGTLKTRPDGATRFLSDQLVGVNVKISPTAGYMELWNIANPRHPIAEGTVDIPGLDAVGIYIPSRQLLTMGSAGQSRALPGTTTLWNLRNLRKPVPWVTGVSMSPGSIGSLNDDIWVALTPDEQAIDVWDVSNPRKPVVTAALPIGRSDGNLYGTTFPGGWLLGTGVSSGGIGDQVYLTKVSTDGNAISDYAQLPGDSGNYAFGSNEKSLATNLSTFGSSGLEAFYPQDGNPGGYPGIVYPFDVGSLYQRLCSTVGQVPPSPSWNKYLPATYYRPACS